MHEVLITEWREPDTHLNEDDEVWLVSDLDTISDIAVTSKDFALSLRETARKLYNHGLHVIATQRDKDGEAWLARCRKRD